MRFPSMRLLFWRQQMWPRKLRRLTGRVSWFFEFFTLMKSYLPSFPFASILDILLSSHFLYITISFIKLVMEFVIDLFDRHHSDASHIQLLSSFYRAHCWIWTNAGSRFWPLFWYSNLPCFVDNRLCRPIMTKPKPAPPKPASPEPQPQQPQGGEAASPGGDTNDNEAPNPEPMDTEKSETAPTAA